MTDRFYSATKEIAGRYNAILKLADDNNTTELQGKLEQKVYDMFKLLQPLSHKAVAFKPKIARNSWTSSETVRVQSWPRTKWSSYSKLGSLLAPDDMIWFARSVPDSLENSLRQQIQEPFSKLVSLTTQLNEFKDVSASTKLEAKCSELEVGSRLEAKHLMVKRLSVRSDDPLNLILAVEHRSEPMELEINTISAVPIVENVIDRVERLYKRLAERVARTTQHNETLVKQMEQTAGPFMLIKK